MILSMYARLMKAGMAMADVDRMDVLRYLDVLEIEQGEGKDAPLRPGTLADIFG